MHSARANSLACEPGGERMWLRIEAGRVASELESYLTVAHRVVTGGGRQISRAIRRRCDRMGARASGRRGSHSQHRVSQADSGRK